MKGRIVMSSAIVFSKAKAVAAGVGSTLTALMVALTAVQLALGDGKVDVGEYSTLFGTAVTLIGTVYAVWRTENKIIKTSL